ncbi:unnamed protein product [Parnassius apollo]|uniref:(apollo) hypothetical protein n=1 Tax=Parnassius apollo TaxID=110799 RepID=A0A8S3XUQ4_PARAO|nr:unnamed protein product [Parnassius apollo]
MSTVDPKPYQTNYTTGRKMDDVPFDDLYGNDELSANDNVHYGLEKVPEDYEARTPYKGEVEWETNFRKSLSVQIPVVVPSISKENATERTGSFRTKKTNKEKSITLMFFPIKDYRYYRRSVNNLDKAGSIKKGVNVTKVVENTNEARMKAIIDPNDLINVERLNNSIKQLNETNKQYEVRSNDTLVYNIGEESIKIVDGNKTCL